MGKRKPGNPGTVAPQERVKRYLVQRFYTRFHMSLILMGAGLAAMVSNWGLLHAGVTKMWMRYPVAVTASYLAFLAGVWLWIQYIDFRRASNVASGDEAENDPHPGNANRAQRKKSSSHLGDVLDLPVGSGGGGGGSSVELPNIMRGGGGQFDGGGASGFWTEPTPVQGMISNNTPSVSSSGGGKSMFDGLGDFFDLDGEAIVLVVLALVLIGSILIASGYIVWFAPDILSEAVFGATLAGTLSGTARRQDNEGWVLGVVKKTWWPFALVFAAAMACAIYANSHYPAAKTLGEALTMAINS